MNIRERIVAGEYYGSNLQKDSELRKKLRQDLFAEFDIDGEVGEAVWERAMDHASYLTEVYDWFKEFTGLVNIVKKHYSKS
jgi:hypothetical protein